MKPEDEDDGENEDEDEDKEDVAEDTLAIGVEDLRESKSISNLVM
jgi:hypothetical protein